MSGRELPGIRVRGRGCRPQFGRRTVREEKREKISSNARARRQRRRRSETHRLGDLVREGLEVLVQVGPPLPLLLLTLQLVLVVVVLPPLLVSGLVEAGIRRLAEELDVLGLLLADEDGVLEVDVEDDDELRVARLEEKMLHVAEEDVCVVGSRSQLSKPSSSLFLSRRGTHRSSDRSSSNSGTGYRSSESRRLPTASCRRTRGEPERQ